MPSVVIRPKALDDLAEIWAYIAEGSPRQADAFAIALDREIRDLARHTLIGRTRPELLTDLRSFPFGRYVIFYLPRKRGIEVVCVLHGARDLSPCSMETFDAFLFQLTNPLSQELPLWFLLGQRQRLLVRRTRLSRPAQPAAHICAGGMRQVIISQFAIFQHRVDLHQPGLWTIAHGDGHSTIELYNWRRLNS
jgi:toxin ParE1/3/4